MSKKNSKYKKDATVYYKFLNEINATTKLYDLPYSKEIIEYSMVLCNVLFGGNIYKAILLGRLLHWSDKSKAHNVDEYTFFKTITELAEETGISTKTISKCLDEFVELEYIDKLESTFNDRLAFEITVYPEKILKDFNDRALTMVGDPGIRNIATNIFMNIDFANFATPPEIHVDSNGHFKYSNIFYTLLKHTFFKAIIDESTFADIIVESFQYLHLLIKDIEAKNDSRYLEYPKKVQNNGQAIREKVIQTFYYHLDTHNKNNSDTLLKYRIADSITDCLHDPEFLSIIRHFGPEFFVSMLLISKSVSKFKDILGLRKYNAKKKSINSTTNISIQN